MKTRSPPVVLCISGHDPIGGAGLQADIEAVAANGCHACTVITCITVQDTCDLASLRTQPTAQLAAQIRAVSGDCAIAVIKVGLLGSAEIAAQVGEFLAAMGSVPVVMDPVLASGGGTSLADEDLLRTIRQRLLPRVTLLTPNSGEARRLAQGPNALAGCAEVLLGLGCANVLITGTHEETPKVVNRLYGAGGVLDISEWGRLAGSYHGSGCTLASAIAARLALQQAAEGPDIHLSASENLVKAVRAGQAYTWRTLDHSLHTGRCQPLPGRFYHLPRP